MLLDTLQRPLGNLRLSVTDRCNLRCQYCMPEADYVWLPRQDILHFEEIDRIVDAFVALGVERVRLTGGEPLLRRDLPILVERLARKTGIRDLAMTTNGVLLAPVAADLARAGLHRITVSLDTLHRDRFVRLARFDELARVRAGIDRAAAIFPGLKIDTVVIRGVNDDEIVTMLEFARERGAEVRFIEYMDVGGATHWSLDQVVSRGEILDRLSAHFGPIVRVDEGSTAPADRFCLADGTVFGVIASTTAPFCRTCDRSRLTADGVYYLCLYATRGLDLRAPLRSGADTAALADIVARAWQARDDRGAEARLALRERAPLISLNSLKRDPHLEMHTRGG
ncbi:MAG: GTP 3',8-cyclase MoaA [Vicinamibacterales bacterium]